MKNIIKIIAFDIKRLSTNVVAMVVIIGLTVIPCLYAWFNILSNWDPYGEDATSHLQVAVASNDQGIMIGNYEINVGDIIIKNLKENKTIGWVFTDTSEEAVGGVHSGEYYAALVIDEQFSADMISFLGGDIENPVITYYENEKKNAIAPKITGKVKTAIQREVDQAFVSTIAETILKAGEYFANIDEQGNITGKGISKLEQLDSDLNGVILVLDSYIALMDSTEQVSEASKEVAKSAKSITKVAEEMAKNAQNDAPVAKEKIQNTKNQVDDKVYALNNKLDRMAETLGEVNSIVAALPVPTIGKGQEIQQKLDVISAIWGADTDPNSLNYLVNNFSTGNEEIDSRIKTTLADLKFRNDTLKNDVQALVDAENQGNADTVELKNKITTDVTDCQNSMANVRAQYANILAPTTQRAINSAVSSVEEIEQLLNYDAKSIDAVVADLKNYSLLMNKSKSSLVKSRDEAVQMEASLAKIISELKGLSENEAYEKFMDLVRSDPELLSEFISSPVEVSNEYVYPVENNGSMTAPFYIVLSIWVGSLIMSTILKTTVKDTSNLDNVKNWQCFFGRYFVTLVIGQIQTLITVLGAFLFVGIQCENRFLFWAACAWSSLVYSLLLYSFAYSFGNVGEALSVILMVIQVAGAGGTFPIEVLPKVFQTLYRFMPFKYSMNALRECIGGFYEHTYKECMLTLLIYVGIAVFIGVVLYHPFKFLNEKIEISKEKSGILL
ncbi:MAG: YhgE/Pip domain-containing protein [Pseudobutyrivibrio sp.]|nr:YhgE/Pip domain-containing protein [Pseudobutyrivibrio sp.]